MIAGYCTIVRTLLSIFAGFSLLCRVGGYNLDTKDPWEFRGGKSGYFFGFSVALHKHQSKRWLLVGAPLSNDTADGVRPLYGAVYKCDLNLKTRRCRPMREFDSESRIARSHDSHKLGSIDYRKGQWMGATVRSAKNYILACAPRLAWRGTVKTTIEDFFTPSNNDNYYQIGKCEVVDSTRKKATWIWNPCKTKIINGKNYYGFCSLGLDANFNSDIDGIIAGAPSLLDFRGRVMAANLYSKTTYIRRDPDLKRESQMGFASVLMKLPGKNEDAFIGGAPNADNRIGQVTVYKTSGKLSLSNPSKQIGSYFGSSLAVADVNGDGNEDLLVGAPYYAVNINEGVVYAYVNTGNDRNLFSSPTSLFGDSKPGARFGLSIANAGDVNLDGFQDLAIGAPYEEKGAVYIYPGSRHGLTTSYMQKITPSLFGSLGLHLSSFGSAISTGVDMDDNGYPDLAIGSFQTDRVVYLRSRPLVSINAQISLEYIQINRDSNKQVCLASDGRKRICLKSTICFQVGGKGVPLPVGVSYELAVDEEQPGVEKRAFLLHGLKRSSKESRLVYVTNQACYNHTAYLLKKPRNVYSPLVFKVSYSYQPQVGCQLCPVMKPGSVEAMATYTKNCGKDLICTADLSVTGKVVIPDNKKEVIPGATQTLSLLLDVQNSKENAYMSKIIAFCPSQLSVIGVHLMPEYINEKWTLVFFNSTHNKLEFNTGNSIGPDEMESYEIEFSIESISTSVQRLVFGVEAVTSSKEVNLENNKMAAFVDVVFLADMMISGVAKPELVTYKENTTLEEPGPSITHSFLIQNKGPSSVESSKVQIQFPDKYEDEYLLNLMSISVKGSVNCMANKSMINPLGIKAKLSTSFARERREIETKLDCTNQPCQMINCEIGSLKRGESVSINLHSTLVDKTFSTQIVKTSAITVTAEVLPLSSTRQPLLHYPDKVELTVQVLAPSSNQRIHVQKKSIPWWIILVSVIAGLLLVAGIVFVFYKGGFFNRKQRDYSFAAVPVTSKSSATCPRE